jgi:hypothetical protein
MLRRVVLTVGWCGAAVLLAAVGPSSADLPARPGHGSDWLVWLTADPEHAVVTGAGVLAWAVFAWLTLGVVLCALQRVPGRWGRWSRRCVPWLVPTLARQTIEAALGLTLAIGTPASALAAPTTAPAGASAVAATKPPGAVPSLQRPLSPHLELAPLPQAPAPVLAPPEPVRSTPAAPHPAHDAVLGPTPPGGPGRAGEPVAVRRGDCLWSVVARHLGDGTSDAEIARAWPRWYAANRSAIGPDPDLLLPGQLLTPPPAG